MKLFENKKSNKYTIIIGCGRLGANIATNLSNEGENVLIMDKDKNSFRRLSSNFGGLSVVGNGTDFDKLNEAKANTATALIAVTNDDNTNIAVAQIAKEVYKINNVVARLYDPDCEKVYKKMGINTICPAVLSAKEIDKMLNSLSTEEAN